jgi:hypothetical protein
VCVCNRVTTVGGGGVTIVTRPLHSSKRPHFRMHESTGKKRILMGVNRTRNKNELCWQGPAAISPQLVNLQKLHPIHEDSSKSCET